MILLFIFLTLEFVPYDCTFLMALYLIYAHNYSKNFAYFIKNLFNLDLIVKKACIFALKTLLMQA